MSLLYAERGPNGRMHSNTFNPPLAQFLVASSVKLLDQGDLAGAAIGFQHALNADPTNLLARYSMGRIAMKKGLWDDAGHIFQHVIQNAPVANAGLAVMSLALIRTRQRRYNEALRLASDAYSLCKAGSEALMQVIAILEETGDFDKVLDTVEAGLYQYPTNPRLREARGDLMRLKGDWEPGWADFECRPDHILTARKLDEWPEWTGQAAGPREPLPEGKRLLVVAEQGVGDQLMFARYLPLLRYCEPWAQIILFTRPEMGRLLAPFADRIVTDDADLPEFDTWTLIGSLPLKLQAFEPSESQPLNIRGKAAEIPEFPDALARYERSIPSGRLRVGICWQGSPNHDRDHLRSVSLETLADILAEDGVQFVNLQLGARDVPRRIYDPMPDTVDLADRAAVIATLDLVITVDTSIAHLAGSLGIETWLLCSKPHEWRWGLTGDTTPWYPTMRLFRQAEVGIWGFTVTSIARELRKAAEEFVAGVRAHKTYVVAAPRRLAGGGTSSLSELSDAVRGIYPEITSAAAAASVSAPELHCRTTRHGYLSYFANDQWIGRALDLYGQWSWPEAELFTRLLNSGDVVCDAGANIGALSTILAHAVGAEGVVHAFEPQRQIFRLLDINLKMNAREENWYTYQCGLGSSEEMAHMADIDLTRTCNPGGSRFATEGEETLIIPLDKLELQRLHLLKAAVQGMELAVLAGAEATIARCRPVLYLESERKESRPALVSWLFAHDYRVYSHRARLYDPNNFNGYQPNVFGGASSWNLLCLPRESPMRFPELERVILK